MVGRSQRIPTDSSWWNNLPRVSFKFMVSADVKGRRWKGSDPGWWGEENWTCLKESQGKIHSTGQKRTGHKKNRGDHGLMEREIYERMMARQFKQRGRGIFNCSLYSKTMNIFSTHYHWAWGSYHLAWRHRVKCIILETSITQYVNLPEFK